MRNAYFSEEYWNPMLNISGIPNPQLFKRQTRFYQGHKPEQRGNCMAACIASLMGIEVEEAFQYQEHFVNGNANEKLLNWLNERGWELTTGDDYRIYHMIEFLEKIGPNDKIDVKSIAAKRRELQYHYYLVSGKSPRQGVNHVCIFRDGELVWDPHPSDEGLLTLEHFYRLEKT